MIVAVALTVTLGTSVAEPAGAVPASVRANTAPSEPLTANDTRSAQLTAKVRKQRVELLNERAEDSTTWVNADGTFTTESFGAPVRLKDGQGKDGWSDVDLDMVEFPDGTVGPRVHPQGLRLAGKTTKGVDGLLASLTDSGGHQVSLLWMKGLPTPVLDGTKAITPTSRLAWTLCRKRLERALSSSLCS